MASVIAAAIAGGSSSAIAASPKHPLTGRYRSTPISGKGFEFKIVKALCPPDERGGAQHQKRGYCFVPVSYPLPVTTCPGGFSAAEETYSLFNTLLRSNGFFHSPLTSSSEAKGEFHITVSDHGTASGYLELTTLHYPSEESPAEICRSGRLSFTAHRA